MEVGTPDAVFETPPFGYRLTSGNINLFTLRYPRGQHLVFAHIAEGGRRLFGACHVRGRGYFRGTSMGLGGANHFGGGSFSGHGCKWLLPFRCSILLLLRLLVGHFHVSRTSRSVVCSHPALSHAGRACQLRFSFVLLLDGSGRRGARLASLRSIATARILTRN